MKPSTRHRLLAIVPIVIALNAAVLRPPSAPVHASGETSPVICIAHRPSEYYSYAPGCTGHDEPELDPVSSAAGSAQDLNWTLVLPTDAITPVGSVGPTFWTGGAVSDPNSQYGQAFLELQFYPDSITTACTAGGGYQVAYTRGAYTACSPVWKINSRGAEVAAFNTMLTDSSGGGPLVMHAGDTISDHQYVTSAQDGMHITVTDLTTGRAGTIVLNSAQDGPLMPAFNAQTIGNFLKWGLVYDTPNSLVWEIGHTGNYTHPPGQFCLPGQSSSPACYSYNIASWLAFKPLQIKGVTFGDGSSPQGWAAVSDFGGEAEINQYCPTYGAPFCAYPWYALNGPLHAFTYGGDYPGTSNDFGQALEFAQTTNCPGPNGPNTTYCDTLLK